MGRIAVFVLPLLFIAETLLLASNGCGFSAGGSSSATLSGSVAPGKIQHVVIIFQENRTPDNLFHDPVLMARGADIATAGINSAGVSIPLLPGPLAPNYDLDHSHTAFLTMYDRGTMRGANNVKVFCDPQTYCPPNSQYYYVQASDAEPYFQMAEQYTFGDRMFQTNEGPSFAAHQFIISGTSAPTATSSSFAAEVPIIQQDTGCAGAPGNSVEMINAYGIESSSMFPCFEHPALTDELNAKGISWRYYSPSAGSLWTAPNAIEHMCGPNAPPPHATACVGSDWINNVVLYSKEKPAPILTDILGSRLTSVSWVIPSGANSDHAALATNNGGPSWVAAIVNAIGNGPYWSNTAIIITWDDWGGWYDHVPPPKVINDGRSWGSGYVYGFRVPLIVVSPYAKAHYISHVDHDFGSILNFVEQTFGLASLGYADAHANDDLSDCFDFNQSPLQFQTIPAPLSADYFLNDRRPPTDPDDD
jgi:phospholipase C